ncbi:MAG TPA: hypothetical protein VIW80_09845 [Pyrinomonadaceae bacterium]|jgi:hypothetical protein
MSLSLRFSRSLVTILLCGGVTLFICSSFNPAGQAQQEEERLIEIQSDSASPLEPVEITAIKTKKGVIKAGEKFKDDDDWVRGLTVKLENVSAKNIVYINVSFSFLRPADHESAGQPPFVDHLTYGSNAMLYSSSQSTRLPTLAPGASVEISLTDKNHEAIKRALKKINYPESIKRLQIYLAEVIFDDDTAWLYGSWFRLDPHNQKLIPIETGRGHAPVARYRKLRSGVRGV